jgi:hypothetical protein
MVAGLPIRIPKSSMHFSFWDCTYSGRFLPVAMAVNNTRKRCSFWNYKWQIVTAFKPLPLAIYHLNKINY